MPTQLDLANAANWEQFYHGSRSAEFIDAFHFRPLPEIGVDGGTLRDSRIIASFATSANAKPTWKAAGWLFQKIRVGVTVGGGLDAVAANRRMVLLKKVQLHFWSPEITSYGLDFFAFRWLQQLDLTLWEYTGPIVDLTQEAIDLTRIDILRTEAKVDALFKDEIQ